MKVKNSDMRYVTLVILVFLTIGMLSVWFYWFQLRPANIRKSCYEWSVENAQEIAKYRIDIVPGEPSEFDRNFIKEGLYKSDDQKEYYENCLHKEGLR